MHLPLRRIFEDKRRLVIPVLAGLALNAVLLGLYTFSCHSWRHLIGGYVDNYSACGLVGMSQNHAWQRQSFLNSKHMEFAWASLVWVGFTDLYIWQVREDAGQ